MLLRSRGGWFTYITHVHVYVSLFTDKLLVCREERARIIEQSGALMNREAQKKQAGGKSPQVSFLIPQRDTGLFALPILIDV